MDNLRDLGLQDLKQICQDCKISTSSKSKVYKGDKGGRGGPRVGVTLPNSLPCCDKKLATSNLYGLPFSK
jgi:hypothetical protein